MAFTHVMLTRFNMATPGREMKIRLASDWLAGRFDLFFRYCVPTIAGQTDQNFEWIVYFDVETPEWARQRIAEAQQIRHFHAYYTPLFDSTGWQRSVREILGERCVGNILTSTLDNDDGLAKDYMARLHEAVGKYAGEIPVAFNFPNGFVLSDGKIYRHRHLHNAFVNFLETADNFRTCQDLQHMNIPGQYPIVQIEGHGAWLQNVHGGNVSNKVRGALDFGGKAKALFPDSLAEEFHNPDTVRIIVDNVIAAPLRQGRDKLARLIRRFIPA